MAVNSIGSINSLLPSRSLFETSEAVQTDNSKIPFADYLKEAMNNTNQLLIDSDNIANEFAVGNIDNIHQVEIAAQKAEIALQFTMQIRNKIMDAYSEIMRMQI
jgi:flagellar hook-basal body complex protein FliE